MKKVLLATALFITICSCSKKDDPSLTENQITGKWVVDYAWSSVYNTYVDMSSVNWYAQFNSGGVYTSHQSSYYTGTWKINGYNVVCQSGSLTINYKVDSISGNKALLEMTFVGAPDIIKLKVTKQ
jgi:hypothetical protein